MYFHEMSEVTLSTIVDSRVKKAALHYCDKRGLKLRYLVEQALVEQLEDAIDLEAFLKRRSEPTYSLAQVLKKRKKS